MKLKPVLIKAVADVNRHYVTICNTNGSGACNYSAFDFDKKTTTPFNGDVLEKIFECCKRYNLVFVTQEEVIKEGDWFIKNPSEPIELLCERITTNKEDGKDNIYYGTASNMVDKDIAHKIILSTNLNHNVPMLDHDSVLKLTEYYTKHRNLPEFIEIEQVINAIPPKPKPKKVKKVKKTV